MRGCGSSQCSPSLPSPSPWPRRSSFCATTTHPRARTGSLTMVGDSLNVGVEPYLADELPAGASGRTTRSVAAATTGSPHSPASAPSSGRWSSSASARTTRRRTPDAFRADVRELLSLAGPERCVVWATIWRGGANAAFNEVLDRRGAREPCAAARRSGTRWWRSTPSGSSATACTDLRRGTPHAPRRSPTWPATACRRPPQ